MSINIKSKFYTLAGYIKPSIPMNDTAECAILNSMTYSLERYKDNYYWHGEKVTVNKQLFNKDSGILSVFITRN